MRYGPDRVQYPIKRVGKRVQNKEQKISWDEALKSIANRLHDIKEQYGIKLIGCHHGHYRRGDCPKM